MLTPRLVVLSSLSILLGAGCLSSEPEPPDVDLVTNAVAEPPGEHCANGGVVVQSGHDVDGDGALDDDEIESADYVCSPPIATLVREDKIAAGAACPSGGVAVHSGRDVDRDAILDDSEIEHTVNVCDVKELWSGDLTTSTWATPEAQAALAQIRVITGSLQVDSAAALPALELVGGDIGLSAATTSMELPALTRVIGGLTVSGQYSAIDMDVLHDIGGNFVLGGKPGSLHVPMLAAIGGSLRLDGVDESTVQLPGVETIGGDVFVFTSNVNTIDLVSLQTVGGDVDVVSASALTALKFPALTNVAGRLDINAQALVTLDLGVLTKIGGDLHVVGTQLTQLQLPQLRELGNSAYSFELFRASKLTTVSVPLLKHTAGMIQFTECAALTAAQFPALTSTHGLVMHSLPNVTEVSAPKLARPRLLQLSAMPQLATIALGAVKSVDGILSVSDTALTDLGGLSALTSARFLHINGNDLLQNLDGLDALAYVELELVIEGNPLVPAAEIESLETRLGF
jgi:hypothetical protein